ncbi:FIMAH domain-containing protein [Rossellomorea aquimaris]|uniref:FIMAH domain-containing protein n=1 Tax=Rossellomorea aquimaris TaxID=189382 RepID=UPI001CFF2E11|nr:Ig-like domain-containing protein [Rossellomorea aquimaris]
MGKSFLRVLSVLLILVLFVSLLPYSKFYNSVSAEAGWSELPVQNGDFEAVPETETAIPSWSYWSGGFKSGMEITGDMAFEGDQSLRINNSGVTGLFSQAVDVTEGNQYKLSAQLFVEELTKGKPGIWLRWYDGEGKNIGNDPKYFDGLALDEWQKVSIEANAPAGAVSMKVFIYQASTAITKGYYDDVKVYEKSNEQLELPFEYGDSINLGPAALAAKTQGAAIGDGEIYYATNGSPATFYANDAVTGEKIFSQSLPGSDVVWGMTVGSDGNVYFAGTYNGILYRYVVDEQRLEEVGQSPSDNWIWQLDATEDGKIYGATYPNAKVFEYDIETDTLTDLGRFHEEQNYARGLGVTDENLYVGIGTTAYLMKMNRETGERKEIQLPISGTSTSVSNVWEYGDRLFVAYGTSMLVLDVETEEVVHEMNWEDEHAYDGLISPPSPYDDSLIYFKDKRTNELWTYDMDTDETQAVEPKVTLPASPVKAYEWTTNEAGEQVLSILHHQIEYSTYNPKTNEVKVLYPEVEKQGLSIQSLEIGPDEKVYMGGYQGSFGVYDTSSESYLLRERNPHQIEGIGFMNGNVYMGIYGGAQIYKYDPELPFKYEDGGSGDNPEMVHDIGDDQSRPFTFASGDDKLFTGTISDYGKLGGALTIFDEKTGEWNTIRNIIENQSIIGLAYKDGMLYGGSTTAGGLGIDPTEKEARMFEYVASTGDYELFDLELDGIKTPEMIGELSFGPDGNLWGAAYGVNDEGTANSVIFAMDPDSKEIVKQKEFYTGVHRGSQWRPFFLRWDDQGMLYTTVARKLTVIDPETMMSKQIIGDTVNLMDIDQEGNIYYAAGADLMKLPVPVKDVELSVEKNTLVQGDTMDLELAVTLANGKEIDLAGAEVKWENTAPDVIQVENGEITALNAGTAEIKATVSYNGDTMESNSIEITVHVTTGSLINQIQGMEESGDLNHDTVQQLVNNLKQAQHHYEKGHTQQALKHLDDFSKHLEKSHAEEGIKTQLEQNVNSIRNTFS